MRNICLLAAVGASFLGAPLFADDSRNANIPNTNTHFAIPRFQSLAEWEKRAGSLRKQVLSAAGLLPMPEKTPLNPQIFGRIENKTYSIEKVYFETLPGFYLAGNLYRPLGKQGKLPGVLMPHGHAEYGRLEHGPLFSVPSRGINMAQQGYVVFAYDMIGYNDTIQIPHAFGGPKEQLWSFGPLGLQTWNSMRALDFLQSLPDVDPEQLSITGESGGGTQTFMLCAVDQRPKVSSPVNMISLIMQGGSPCENAPGLRVSANNVEIAALMAPRPMLMVSATGDWTRNTPQEEFPAMKAIYALYDKAANVQTVMVDAPHNYNQASREAVYGFFAQHILKDPRWSEYKEKRIRQEKLQDMMVFHHRALPDHAVDLPKLFSYWIAAARKQTAETRDAADLKERLTVAIGVTTPSNVTATPAGAGSLTLSRQGIGDRIPAYWSPGPKTEEAVLVIHPAGSETAKNSPAANAAMGKKALLTIDAFQTGSAKEQRDRSHPYFLTFNRSDDANRVQDIVTAIAYLKQSGYGKIRLIGIDSAAVWATFAAAVSDIPVALEAELGTFRGEDDDFLNRFFIPGIQRAGGLEAAKRVLAR